MMALDIVRPTAAPRPRYSVERTLALPAYWRGAAKARTSLRIDGDDPLRYHRDIARAELIEGALERGEKLPDIAAYADWLGPDLVGGR